VRRGCGVDASPSARGSTGVNGYITLSYSTAVADDRTTAASRAVRAGFSIVWVWLAVMLFRHEQAAAIALAGAVLVLGGGTLFVRNRSLRQ
jgi:hypothetical protein